MIGKYFSLKSGIRLVSVAMILMLAFTTLALAQGGGRFAVDPWSFGVHGDTQWYVSGNYNAENPNWVSAAIASAFNEQFIDYKNTGKYDVKFVIQVGDLTDRAGNAAMYTRAAVAQPLYDTGIGFFPLRGNHETYGNLYGLDPDHDMNIPAYLDAFPQTRGMANTFEATNFSSPDIEILNGLSYAFDHYNASFVILDVEQTLPKEILPEIHPIYGTPYDYIWWVVYQYTAEMGDLFEPGTWFRIASSGSPSTNFYGFDAIYPVEDWASPSQPKWDATGTEYWPGDQQAWIDERLDKDTNSTEHAFVFSHRGLMGADHVDGTFGSNPGSKAYQQNPFYASLMNNGVKYMISGHDHIHNRALVESPDGESMVEQLISIGASNKFYDPAPLNDFIGYYGDVKQREAIISQETWTVGYYIYTVDGPRVTVDYYSDYEGFEYDGDDYPDGSGSGATPDFDFVKKETWGYSQNGQQFLVAQGDSYAGIEDSFGETTAKILAGINNSTTTDYTPTVTDDNGTPDDPSDDMILSAPRPLNKTVNTGWVANPDTLKLKSDIFSLWGMSELGAEDQTDTYVLSMSFDFRRMRHLGAGCIGIATYVGGAWVNAVDENFGGEKNFVVGPYSEEYGLGTYGVDPSTKTAWAVLNYNADFAVSMDIESVPGQAKKQSRNGK